MDTLYDTDELYSAEDLSYSQLGGYLSIEVLSSSSATVAVVEGMIGEDIWEGSGTAKLAPGDKFDVQVGEQLALGRALESLGRALIRQGTGREKCLVDNREQSKRQKAERKEYQQYSQLEAERLSPATRKRRFGLRRNAKTLTA